MSNSRVLSTQNNAITRGFGNGHSGVDLGWQTIQNDVVIAHSDGEVTFCQSGYGNDQGSSGNASYGNCVKIQHPNNYRTLYAHLSAVFVSYGSTVKKGQAIGRMGNTGNSYGSHLHFEVRNTGDICIDPAPYLAADLPGLPTKKNYTKGTYEVTVELLNVRTGHGTNYPSIGFGSMSFADQIKIENITGGAATGYVKGLRASVNEVSGSWGKTSSGWICLDYTKKISEKTEEEDMDQATFEKHVAAHNTKVEKKPESSWSVRDGSWKKAVAKGIFDGTMPQAPATREQLAAVLDRMGLLD